MKIKIDTSEETDEAEEITPLRLKDRTLVFRTKNMVAESIEVTLK